jgi:hypothetical protein
MMYCSAPDAASDALDFDRGDRGGWAYTDCDGLDVSPPRFDSVATFIAAIDAARRRTPDEQRAAHEFGRDEVAHPRQVAHEADRMPGPQEKTFYLRAMGLG